MRRSLLESQEVDLEKAAAGCRLFIIGMLVVGVDLNPFGYGFILDFAGWGLVLIGTSRFRRMIPSGLLLLVLTAVIMVIVIPLEFLRLDILDTRFSPDSPLDSLVNAVIQLLLLVYVWVLCAAIMELSLFVQWPGIRKRANWGRWLFLASMIAGLIGLQLSEPSSLLMLVSGLSLLISLLLIVVALNQVSRALRDEGEARARRRLLDSTLPPAGWGVQIHRPIGPGGDRT